MERRFQGVYSIVFTPLTEQYSIDVPALKKSIHFLIEEGVHGLVVLGSNGESPFLTDAERREVIDTSVAACDGRVPVIVGTTYKGTDATIELGRYARQVGADALLSALPIYYMLEEEAIFHHYQFLSEKLDIPILYYNFPMATHLEMPPEQILRLASIKNIVGVKESIADITEVETLAELTRELPFDIFTGTSMNFFLALQRGAHGVMCPLVNLIPKTMLSLWDAFRSGDHEKAEELQFSFPELVTLFISTPTPHAVMKEAMRLLGHDMKPVVKRPLPPLTGEQARFVRENLEKAGMIGK